MKLVAEPSVIGFKFCKIISYEISLNVFRLLEIKLMTFVPSINFQKKSRISYTSVNGEISNID